MTLKDVLARLAQEGGSMSSTAASGHATGKSHMEPSGSASSISSMGFVDGRDEITEEATCGVGAGENAHASYNNNATLATYATALKERGKTGSKAGSTFATACYPGLHPAAWQGEAEDVAPQPVPAPRLRRAPNPPAESSLVQRLVAAGATVRTWSNGRGGQASVEAPAGIPAGLVAEVDRRGWRIIPGGKANPEADHDSWAFGGVGIQELD